LESLVVASAFPWVTVLVINARGIDNWRGFVTVASGLATATYAASQIWGNFIESKIHPSLRLGSISLTIVSICIYSEIGYKTVSASREIANIGNDTNLGLGDLGEALGDLSNSVAKQFNPQLAVGWYVGLLASVLSIVLLLFRNRSKAGQQVHGILEREQASAQTTGRRLNLVVSAAVLASMGVAALVGLLIWTSKDSGDGNTQPVKYKVSQDIKGATYLISIDVVKQVEKWNSFGYAKYTVWADRFLSMNSAFSSIASEQEELKRALKSDFAANAYSDESFITSLLDKFESKIADMQVALDDAWTCSAGFPKENECKPQFDKVAFRLGALKESSDRLFNYLS